MATLISRWCPSTHTFIAAWGEFTPTLEDVAALFSLNIAGRVDLNSYALSSEEQHIVNELEIGSSACQLSAFFLPNGDMRVGEPASNGGKADYRAFMRYFWEERWPGPMTRQRRQYIVGDGVEQRLAAYLACWLSKFIFGGSPEDGPCSHLFGLAAMLSCGRVLLLGQIFLGSLYMRLDMVAADMRRSVGRYDIATHVSYLFL